MFAFWGDGSKLAMDLVEAIRVRSTENFNWTFFFKPVKVKLRLCILLQTS